MATWAEEEASLDAAVTEAFGVSVTFRKTTKGAYTASAGTRAQTTADTTVSIQRGRSRVTIGDGGKRIEITTWGMGADQLAAGVEPQVNDLLIAGGQTHYITSASRSLNTNRWEIETQRSIS